MQMGFGQIPQKQRSVRETQQLRIPVTIFLQQMTDADDVATNPETTSK